jgi:hypothetical protein
LSGKAARADELEKMVDSYSNINKEMLSKANKVNVATHKAAEEHVRVLKEMDGLKTRLAESKKARAEAEALSKATKVSLQEFEKACLGLKLKYENWKAKDLRAMKQLSFVPWLQDQAWACGYN